MDSHGLCRIADCPLRDRISDSHECDCDRDNPGRVRMRSITGRDHMRYNHGFDRTRESHGHDSMRGFHCYDRMDCILYDHGYRSTLFNQSQN
jgi:hypothetical protein